MQYDTGTLYQARTGARNHRTSHPNVRELRYAVNKYRWKIVDAGVLADCSFRNGALLAAGTVLITQGVIRACNLTKAHAPKNSLQLSTGYLLQVSLLPSLPAHKSYLSTDLCWIFPA
jgi:hypothetical protein